MNKHLVSIRKKIQYFVSGVMSPVFLSKLYFKKLMGYSLNLENPRTLNEKIQWLKLNDYPNNPTVIECADKYTMRDYLARKGLSTYLNELYGVWDDCSGIDWDALPDKFVIKVSNGCGYNYICTNKNSSEIKVASKKIRKWMKLDFGRYKIEPHYSKMKSRIICEKYLAEDIKDYKFFCLNGKNRFMYIAEGSGVAEKETFFTADGTIADFYRKDYPVYPEACLPHRYDEMKRVSELIASDFPLVRVDWYEVDDRPFIGELTFSPGGGFIKFTPEEVDLRFGELLDIDNLIKKRD